MVSSQESVASIMNQATVGVGTSVGAVASLIGMSSPVGVFAMINQFQLLLLILISGVYLSDGVKVTINREENNKLKSIIKYNLFKISFVLI